jgi:hypothetical protein
VNLQVSWKVKDSCLGVCQSASQKEPDPWNWHMRQSLHSLQTITHFHGVHIPQVGETGSAFIF